MDKRDCIYPDCLVWVRTHKACEHSCEYEQEMKKDDTERRKAIRKMVAEAQKLNLP